MAGMVTCIPWIGRKASSANPFEGGARGTSPNEYMASGLAAVEVLDILSS